MGECSATSVVRAGQAARRHGPDTVLVPAPTFPFTPKTTAYVRAGDFWGIPLRRGGWYACGRVLRLGDSRVDLTIGLLDWCEPTPPTTDNIAGARVLDYGSAHIKTIGLEGVLSSAIDRPVAGAAVAVSGSMGVFSAPTPAPGKSAAPLPCPWDR
jgi:hypothetical protein